MPFILCFVLIIITDIKAQYGYIPARSWRAITEMETIDSGTIRIWYALNAEDIKNQDTYDDWQCLEIGSKMSRYYSYFIFRSDSLCTEWKKNNTNAQSSPGSCSRGGKKNKIWSEYFFSDYVKDFSAARLMVYTLMPIAIRNQQYSEELPVQDWSIYEDTLTIAGQLCQKATCHFRGRDYTAWFAPDIPVNNGPWKFGGLPGLIMKVYDADNLYVFECNKIESRNQDYPLKLYKTKYEETDRKKYAKLIRDIHDDYGKMIQLTNMDGTPVPKI